ncbi:hypothetical protein [Nocardia sp. BMG51109]|uniref:hypothetical protein n=1 Tax=Nocardia sp. BMG51109 TaxID=1056816 RepID=UPI0004673A25|nr:hypothetical protein [Nocardia sp. BMG51109]
MPDDHPAAPSDRPTEAADRPVHHVYYGLSPDRPAAFTVPPVEATPDTPLPDAAPFLRVCAGAEEPSTVMLRGAREFVGIWRHVYEQRPKDMNKLNEQLSLYTWFIDREAVGHTKDVVYQEDTPLSPSTYGQWVAWLVWKYVLYALRQHDPEHGERDAAELSWYIQSFDELVTAVRAGQLRLPDEQGDEADGAEFPPRRVWPEGYSAATDDESRSGVTPGSGAGESSVGNPATGHSDNGSGGDSAQ